MGRGQTVDEVRRLRESLGELPEPVVKPALVVVSGLPGTGKSHFSHRLSQRTSVAIVESDALRKLMFSCPSYDSEESARLFKAVHRLVLELLREGISLVLDATNLGEHHREHLYHIAEQTGAKLIVVQICAPPELVYRRLQGRARDRDPQENSDADWQVYGRMRSAADVIRRNHFRVDTSRDIGPALEKIASMIER